MLSDERFKLRRNKVAYEPLIFLDIDGVLQPTGPGYKKRFEHDLKALQLVYIKENPEFRVLNRYDIGSVFYVGFYQTARGGRNTRFAPPPKPLGAACQCDLCLKVVPLNIVFAPTHFLLDSPIRSSTPSSRWALGC
mgnify:CR=1 FL=1